MDFLVMMSAMPRHDDLLFLQDVPTAASVYRAQGWPTCTGQILPGVTARVASSGARGKGPEDD